jgi:phenylalanyl-tRNA synthetase alpha chain
LTQSSESATLTISMQIDELHALQQKAQEDISNCPSLDQLEQLRTHYLGKKGAINSLTKTLAGLSPETKKSLGIALNQLKTAISQSISERQAELKNQTNTKKTPLQKSLPGKKPEQGHLHVTTIAIREIAKVFKPLGFKLVRYPEIDWEYFAFEALNIPETHPARDEWETFFVDLPSDKEKGRVLITPHTSNGQIHEMLREEPPIRMLNISRCGRRQSDVSHNPSFFQFEGLFIDKNIGVTHLKGITDYFVKHFYTPDREIRLRPYDFRFTEPSFEIDISCDICKGKGCRLCKGGWVELGGAGMVHPEVLKAGGIDPKEYSGFAFGWGIERTLMMRSGTSIDDIRHLMGNDLRFLDQF